LEHFVYLNCFADCSSLNNYFYLLIHNLKS
jgi:hypothetical protein